MNLYLLSSDELEKVKRMAAAAFSYEEISTVLELDATTFRANMQDGSPIYNAYRSGLLSRQLELRERIFKDAKNGSSPAQAMAYKLLNDAEINNRL